MASGLLPKSPVSSSLCDEVPHIFIPKSHLEPREFLISSAKRLLQHNRHMADNPTVPAFVRFWNQSGQRSIVALNCSAAIDPQATWVPVICEQSGHPDKFHRFRTVASYGIVRSLKGI